MQEPIIGYALQLPYEDFYQFTKEYIETNVHQGYCAVALDKEQNVVGALVGDTNALEIIEGRIFEGTFANMNILMGVLEDIDIRFLNDYKIRYGKEMEDGDAEGNFIVHKYETSEHLNSIPANVADGIYIIVKDL